LPENIGKVKKSNCVKFSRYYRATQRVFINSFDPNIIKKSDIFDRRYV